MLTKKLTKKIDVTYVILVLSILFALGFIILLAKENGELRTRLSSAPSTGLVSDASASSGYISGPPELQAGDRAHPFEARDLNGKSVSIVYNGESKYFFYIYSAFCGTCMSQVSSWRSLSMKAKAGGYRPIGLSLEDPGRKTDEVQILKDNSTLLIMPDMAIRRTFRATSIPMLALVSADGKVEWVHYGVVNDKIVNELTDKFNSSK